MAARKSRIRKTADKMASYREQARKGSSQGSRSSTPRKSPRRTSSKSSDDAPVAQNSSRSNSPKQLGSRKNSSSDLQDRPHESVKKASRPETDEVIPETPPGSPVKGVMQTFEMTELEKEMIIPETPPKMSLVARRKRAFAARAHAPMNAGDGRDDEQSPLPSKKRKKFQTSRCGMQEDRWGVDGSEIISEGSPVTSIRVDHEEKTAERVLLGNNAACSNTLHSNSSGRNKRAQGQLSADGFSRRRESAPEKTRKNSARQVSAVAQIEGHDHDLQMLTTSSEALSRLFESFHIIVVTEIRELYKNQKEELSDLKTSLTNAVMCEVRDLRGVMEMICAGNKTAASGRVGSKTSVGEWEKKLNRLTPKLDAIFNKEVLSHIVSYNAPNKVVEVYEKSAGSDSERLSTAVQSLLFSLQPKDTKHNLAEGNGRLHSEFRFSVVNNVFFNVCRDNFGIFSKDGSKPAEKQLGVMTNKLGVECGITRPSWLEAEFVTTAHISAARNIVERLNQSRKSKVRDVPSPDDIARHAAIRVYRQLGSHLHKGREHMRTAFFQKLGYLFVSWQDFVSDNDQKNMSLVFEAEDVGFSLDLDDIPYTETCSITQAEEEMMQAQAKNKALMRSMFAQFPDLVLHVKHDVHVTSGGGAQRKHSGGEKRPLKRIINLLEVAGDVLVEYTRIGNIDMFLSRHKTSLKSVMIFAYLIKKLVIKFMDDSEQNTLSLPKPQDVVVQHTSLKEFLPGATIQEAYINSRCLRFDEKIYTALNSAEIEQDEEYIDMNGEYAEKDRIVECLELGVGRI